MIHKNHLFWGQNVKSKGHEAQKSIAGVGLCTPVSAGFFYSQRIECACVLRVTLVNCG